MTDHEKPSGASQDDIDGDAKDEAGEREQGVLTEDSDDLSSPQLTERRNAGDFHGERARRPARGLNAVATGGEGYTG
jgi:hypothetical protein